MNTYIFYLSISIDQIMLSKASKNKIVLEIASDYLFSASHIKSQDIISGK